jgi:hypothetical protein
MDRRFPLRTHKAELTREVEGFVFFNVADGTCGIAWLECFLHQRNAAKYLS